MADPIDREASTPRVSGSFAAFHDAAVELAAKCAPHAARPLARALRDHALAMAAIFSTWPEYPPDVEARSATIQELVELNGQIHAYLDGVR